MFPSIGRGGIACPRVSQAKPSKIIVGGYQGNGCTDLYVGKRMVKVRQLKTWETFNFFFMLKKLRRRRREKRWMRRKKNKIK